MYYSDLHNNTHNNMRTYNYYTFHGKFSWKLITPVFETQYLQIRIHSV